MTRLISHFFQFGGTITKYTKKNTTSGKIVKESKAFFSRVGCDAETFSYMDI